MNTIMFGVPGSLLKDYIGDADIPCTSESEAMALAAGAIMAGKDPVVYMQNSGLGYCVDILMSLYRPYGIPMPRLLLSIRHTPVHHRYMGEITYGILALVGYDQRRVTVIDEK